MKPLKTATIIIGALITLSVIAYFIPFSEILPKIPLIGKLYSNTSITINSRNGKAVIKINEKEYGETPQTITDLPEGNYSIEMTRIADGAYFYKPKTISLELTRNTEAVVDIEIGPNEITAGYLLYYTPSPLSSKGNGYLSISSTPELSDVYLEGEFLLKTPITSYEIKEGNYTLKIIKEGYEEIEFPIVIRQGYNLNIISYLYPIPINIEKP